MCMTSAPTGAVPANLESELISNSLTHHPKGKMSGSGVTNYSGHQELGA